MDLGTLVLAQINSLAMSFATSLAANRAYAGLTAEEREEERERTAEAVAERLRDVLATQADSDEQVRAALATVQDMLARQADALETVRRATEGPARAGGGDPEALVLAVMQALAEEPGRKHGRFEKLYRNYVANETSRIRLLGIRTPEVVDFDLETAWVDLGVAALRQTARPGELGEELEGVTSLEDMRERLGSLGRDPGEAAGSVDGMLAEQKRLVIVGAPGSGKTTLMRYLAHLAAKGELRKVGERLNEEWLPVLFLVRSLNFSALPKPEEFIAHLAPNLAGQYPEGFATQQLAEGRAFILVDGLDECEKASHAKVLAWIRDLTNSFGDCRFLVTSRPAGYHGGELRGCGYGEAELQPLGEWQRKAFVERWYRAAGKTGGGPTAAQDAKKGADDLLSRIARTKSVRTLAANPLLLSVLCVVHRYRRESLPERRAQLLDECVDVLLHEWRQAHLGRRPELVGDLDASGKAALVRPLAWWMMQARIAEVRRADVERVFRGVLPWMGQNAERAPELLDHVRDCSGLLVEQRPGVFAFAHLVFQEYLAAEHGEDEGEWDALFDHAGDEQWQEVIPLAASLSAKAARTLVGALMDGGHVPLAGRCVATSLSLPPAVRREVVEALVTAAGSTPDMPEILVSIGDGAVVEASLAGVLSATAHAADVARGFARMLPAAYGAACREVAGRDACRDERNLLRRVQRDATGEVQHSATRIAESAEEADGWESVWATEAELEAMVLQYRAGSITDAVTEAADAATIGALWAACGGAGRR
jgi:energy-coupling factor transporter ATP-binding protein EcfA2